MKKKTKRLLGFLMTLVLVFGMLPDMSLYVKAAATDDDAVEVSWGEGDPEGAYTIADNKLTLNKNVETVETIPTGISELDLNGYGIRYKGTSASFGFIRGLTLKDSYSGQDRVHYITVDENGRGISVKNEGTESATCFKVRGGYITGVRPAKGV